MRFCLHVKVRERLCETTETFFGFACGNKIKNGLVELWLVIW